MIIEKLDVSPDLLGESPVWDPASRRLFWIDAWRGFVRALHPSSGREESWNAPGRIGSIALMHGNRILAALRGGGLQQLELDTSLWTPLAAIPSPDPDTYLNDGKTDRRGRFVCGSVATNGKPIGELYRFTAPGRIETLATGIRLSNGICFSPSGDRMYFTDTLSRKTQVFPYDPDSGAVGEPSCLFDVNSIDSMADGATVDSDGHLWASMPRTGEIAQISPAGELIQLIKMPVEFPSCTAFGGDDLDILYVTTIKDSGSGRAVSKHPDGGAVFAITGLGVRGLAETRVAASLTGLKRE